MPARLDYYRLVAPTPPAGQAQTMTVMVWGLHDDGLNPTVTVYDATGTPVAAELVESGDGTYIIRVDNPQAGATYYVSVQAPATATGAFFLGIDFNTQPIVIQQFASGQLGVPGPIDGSASPTSPTGTVMQDFQSVVLQQNTLFQFDFTASTLARRCRRRSSSRCST